MKKAILGTIVAGAIAMSSAAQAFTIHNVGTVNAYSYNELLNKHLKDEMEVWVGITDDGDKMVQFSLDGGLQTFKMQMYPNGHSKYPEVAPASHYENWMTIINKTIEWSNVAKENKVDYEKGFDNGCKTAGYKCSASFSAWADGAKSTVHLDIEDSSNQFINWKGQIPIAEMEKLKQIMTEGVPAKFQELDAKPVVANKDELFK